MKKNRPLAAKPAAAGSLHSFMRDADGRLNVKTATTMCQGRFTMPVTDMLDRIFPERGRGRSRGLGFCRQFLVFRKDCQARHLEERGW